MNPFFLFFLRKAFLLGYPYCIENDYIRNLFERAKEEETNQRLNWLIYDLLKVTCKEVFDRIARKPKKPSQEQVKMSNSSSEYKVGQSSVEMGFHKNNPQPDDVYEELLHEKQAQFGFVSSPFRKTKNPYYRFFRTTHFGVKLFQQPEEENANFAKVGQKAIVMTKERGMSTATIADIDFRQCLYGVLTTAAKLCDNGHIMEIFHDKREDYDGFVNVQIKRTDQVVIRFLENTISEKLVKMLPFKFVELKHPKFWIFEDDDRSEILSYLDEFEKVNSELVPMPQVRVIIPKNLMVLLCIHLFWR